MNDKTTKTQRHEGRLPLSLPLPFLESGVWSLPLSLPFLKPEVWSLPLSLPFLGSEVWGLEPVVHPAYHYVGKLVGVRCGVSHSRSSISKETKS